jgi:hypothetical protein
MAGSLSEDRHSAGDEPRGRSSAWTLVGILTAAMALPAAAKPLVDFDVWWHVRTGQLIIDSHSVPHVETWSWTAAGRPWVATSWLADVLFGGTYDAFGWRGVLLLRLLGAALLLGVLARYLLRDATPFNGLVFAIVALGLMPFLTERPQLFSLIFAVWLAAVLNNARRGQLPRPLVFLAITYFWTNVHGMWILAPAMLVLGSLAHWLDDKRDAHAVLRKAALMAAGACALAALTPAGPRIVYWSVQVRSATAGLISEWQPTVLWNIRYCGTLVLMVLLATTWARARSPVPWSEVVVASTMFVFSIVAVRYVAPALILMAPIVVERLNSTFRLNSRVLLPRWVAPTTFAAGIALATVLAFSSAPLAKGVPTGIVAQLKAMPQSPVRVLNDYNVGGVLTGFGAPEVSVAIDGRTDVYAPDYVERYIRATRGLVDWEQLVDSLDPDAAVLGHDGALARLLVEQRGWTIERTEGAYDLLLPPP